MNYKKVFLLCLTILAISGLLSSCKKNEKIDFHQLDSSEGVSAFDTTKVHDPGNVVVRGVVIEAKSNCTGILYGKDTCSLYEYDLSSLDGSADIHVTENDVLEIEAKEIMECYPMRFGNIVSYSQTAGIAVKSEIAYSDDVGYIYDGKCAAEIQLIVDKQSLNNKWYRINSVNRPLEDYVVHVGNNKYGYAVASNGLYDFYEDKYCILTDDDAELFKMLIEEHRPGSYLEP